jgi:ribosomal protein S18 acetylase RimI-like enzyme
VSRVSGVGRVGPGGPLGPVADALLRPAEAADLDDIVGIRIAARTDAADRGLMPLCIDAVEDVRHRLADALASDETWVAESGTGAEARPSAYVRLTATWIDDLYVHPDHQQRGLGSTLLELAMSLRPGGLGLYVFETNLPARRLYEAHGFVVIDRGCDNEEGEPDLRMEWVP